MNKLWNLSGLAVVVLAGAGLVGVGLMNTGCKSTPGLTGENAKVLLQAYYDQRPGETIVIMVDKTGLQQGLDAKYWKLTKVYPNHLWADYTLTPEGKKLITVNGGGDVMQWRPDNNGDAHFYVTTVAATHPRALNVDEPQNDIVPDVKTAKSTHFDEGVDFTDIPQPLQDIAHNPGNDLSTRREADFSLESGVWKVHSVN